MTEEKPRKQPKQPAIRRGPAVALALIAVLVGAAVAFGPRLAGRGDAVPAVAREPGRFALLVARFSGDPGDALRQRLLAGLRGKPFLQVLPLERELWPAGPGGDEEAALGRGQALAREILSRSGADAVLWGTAAGTTPSLYWTAGAQAAAADERPGRLARSADTVRLPQPFWSELGSVLPLLARSALVDQATAPPEPAEVAELAGLAAEVAAAVPRLCEATPTLLACGQLNDALGQASQALCDLQGEPQVCIDAATADERALLAFPPDRLPVERARITANLAAALRSLGALGPGTAALEASVKAQREAVALVSREAHPALWASLRRGLGASLLALGQRVRDPTPLREAVEALRDAAAAEGERRSARSMAQLGAGLGLLGERLGDPAVVREGIAQLRGAVAGFARESRLRDWGIAANNLAQSLNTLGQLTGEAAPFEESLQVLRPALELRTRERSPGDWAISQVNLGVALLELGRGDAGAERLLAASRAFRETLAFHTREQDPFTWATIQRAIGDAEAALAARDPGGDHRRAAEAAWREAQLVFTREAAPAEWAALEQRRKALGGGKGGR